nr:flavodoxin [Streptococcus lutetiensis]
MNKTLIIYFSLTGTTEGVAKKLAEKLQADLYEIKPAKIYSRQDLDWTVEKCRANLEQKDSTSRPAYQGELPDISQYDTVIFGHPIWWGIPPRILYTVIEDMDLTGKKVASFATSGGSTYSGAQIEMDCLLGKPIRGSVLSNDSSIDNWLSSSGLLG